MSSGSDPLKPVDLPPSGLFYSAFLSTAEARASLSKAELLPINLDVRAAATTVLRAQPRVARLREPILAYVPPLVDVKQIDQLQVLAESLFFANVAYRAASRGGESLPKLAAQAVEIRESLFLDLRPLARRNLIDGARLAEIKRGPGYLNIATEVGVLARIFRERWAEVAPRSGIQLAEVEEAEQMSARLALAFANRTTQSTASDAAADARQRAYTLMVRAYDQARRAALFLRWEQGDADEIVPSLWARRGGRGSKASKVPHDAGAEGAPTKADESVAPEHGTAEETAVASHGDASETTPSASVPGGHPGGSSPFSR